MRLDLSKKIRRYNKTPSLPFLNCRAFLASLVERVRLLYSIPLDITGMDPQTPPTDPQPAPQITANRRVEAASDFLGSCDRLSTEYESGYY